MSIFMAGIKLGSSAVRCFSTSSLLSCSKGQNLSALSVLRKKTGISIIRVKRALEKFDNNMEEAEKWLAAEAKREGWDRAQKLQGRPMSQGLIGMINVGGNAAMVEVNCETDFVAKNEQFQQLVTAATLTCLEHGKASGLNKVIWNKEELGQLETDEGTPLEGVVNDKMSRILENMALRRAAFFSPKDSNTFTGTYIHFAGQDTMCVPRDVLMGRYAGLVTFTHDKPPPEEGADDHHLTWYEIGNQLAQHIVGMNPRKIGDPETNKPRRNKDKETKLIFQEFLLDEDLTVQEYLEENKVQVLDFLRFGLGEEEMNDAALTDDEADDNDDDVEEVTGEVDEGDENKEIKREQ